MEEKIVMSHLKMLRLFYNSKKAKDLTLESMSQEKLKHSLRRQISNIDSILVGKLRLTKALFNQFKS